MKKLLKNSSLAHVVGALSLLVIAGTMQAADTIIIDKPVETLFDGYLKIYEAPEAITQDTKFQIPKPNADTPLVIYSFEPTQGVQKEFGQKISILATDCSQFTCTEVAGKPAPTTGVDLNLILPGNALEGIKSGEFGQDVFQCAPWLVHLGDISTATQLVDVSPEGSLTIDGVILPAGCANNLQPCNIPGLNAAKALAKVSGRQPAGLKPQKAKRPAVHAGKVTQLNTQPTHAKK